MKSFWVLTGLMIMLVALGTTSCVQRFKVTSELAQPLSRATEIKVGDFADNLPADMDPSKKPTDQDIENFRGILEDKLAEMLGDLKTQENPIAGSYVVQGSILTYSKGNGFLRFMFGAWAGAAKVTMTIKLLDPKESKELFSGNFTGAVTDGLVSGSKMWEIVAKDIAKELKKETEKLLKAQKP